MWGLAFFYEEQMYMLAMMKRLMNRLLLLAVAWLCLTGCADRADAPLARSGNGVYYWRTVFALDSVEQAFLGKHGINTLYCRYFDVVMEGSQPVPNATIRFSRPVPEGLEVVPTVFIMNDCMQRGVNIDSLAVLIVRRVCQMNETHDIAHVRELQIDCDYTLRNRELYYSFLQTVRREARHRGMDLSVTVRLHQLSMPPPPADYGVLMLYNTGSIGQYAGEESRNPILDMRDVQPYLRHLKGYALPMGAAYPVFLWQRDVHGVLIDHVADYDEILRTKRAVEQQRDDLRQFVLTYHLDHDNIDRYTPKQYEAIYEH